MRIIVEDSLKDFLEAGNQLSYDFSTVEPGEVRLGLLSELALGVIWVSPENGDGYYEIPAVSLTKYCQACDPEFILLWLPNEQVYGAWDCDHWELIVFENVSWEEIVADPALYINAQWDSNSPVAKKVIPANGYELKSGMPF